MIYFVQAVQGGPIKIGTTENLDVRIKQLESAYRTELAILATKDGSYDEEKAIHDRFSHLRFGYTEQFRPAPELMEFISRPLFANATDVKPMETIGIKGVLTLKCHDEWKEWLTGFAETETRNQGQLIDVALAEYAKLKGYKSPPRR
jgi:hypothetical protein